MPSYPRANPKGYSWLAGLLYGPLAILALPLVAVAALAMLALWVVMLPVVLVMSAMSPKRPASED